MARIGLCGAVWRRRRKAEVVATHAGEREPTRNLEVKRTGLKGMFMGLAKNKERLGVTQKGGM